MFQSVLNTIRETANRVDVKWGVGAKLREQTKGFRDTIVNLDEKLGATSFVKKVVPPAWAKVQEFRATPFGRIANSLFYIWLFFSGFFWTLLTIGITGVFLTNLLFPNFFAEKARKMQEAAQARFAQQQGAGGGMPGGMGGNQYGGMGGMGGMGGNPYGGMGGGAGMGGAPGAGANGTSGGAGRKSYGSGDVFDVDADVKDA